MIKKGLQDRVALVTGGASGIGHSIVERFGQEGARVIVADIQSCEPQSAAAFQRTDVSDSGQVRALFETIAKEFGKLDILVNCAGIAEPPERWHELNRIAEAQMSERTETGRVSSHWDVTLQMDDDTWHRMIRVHLDGTFYCTRSALELMSRQMSGNIINLSSTAALTGLPDAPHYSAAKAGVIGFSRAVAREVGSRNIRVNVICPGFVETPLTELISSQVRSASLGGIPLGRWAEPTEIANTVLFLASDESSYVTGQILSPNGGLLTG